MNRAYQEILKYENSKVAKKIKSQTSDNNKRIAKNFRANECRAKLV